MSAQRYQTAGGHILDRDTILDLARRAGVTAEELAERKPIILKDLAMERQIERVDGKVVRIGKIQDEKFGVLAVPLPGAGYYDCSMANLETGKPIPKDEPIMIFRAQDALATAAINEYVLQVTNKGNAVHPMTVASAAARLEAFQRFQREHPDRVKLPS